MNAGGKILFPASPLVNRLNFVGKKSSRMKLKATKFSGLIHNNNSSEKPAHRNKLLFLPGGNSFFEEGVDRRKLLDVA